MTNGVHVIRHSKLSRLKGTTVSTIECDYQLVPEMADAGEDHRHITLVSRGDYFGIPNRSARLNGTGRAGISGGEEAVRKWKERITGNCAALQ